jgi:RHS repeat-associated protein
VNGDGLSSFDYGPDGELLSEKRPDGTRLEHLWHEGRPIVATTGTQTAYVYTDQLGTLRLLRNAANGAVLWQWNQAEAFWANPVAGTWAGVYNLRFPGQYFDKESGLHYNWFRYYSPDGGRYISSDPIGLDGGNNTYTYVGGNPVSYVDLSGLQSYMCEAAGLPAPRVRILVVPIEP